MGFKNNAFAKVWSVEQISPMNTKARISVSRKDKKEDKYVQDFSGYVNFIGADNAKKAMALHEGDRIKLGDVDVSTTYDSNKKTTYTNFKVFSFETDGGSTKQKQDVYEGDVDDKNQLMEDLLTTPEIVKLIRDDCEPMEHPEELAYVQVFPHEYIPETIEHGATYICFDVDIQRSMNHKEGSWLIWERL